MFLSHALTYAGRMAIRPVILSIDDDQEVLRAVARDLRLRYNRDYRVLSSSSGAEALEALEQLKQKDEPVALLVSDHRMPIMDGVSFLEQAIKIFPKAKRVLLTAYADTDAAIRAINVSRIDYYLLKPWDPPEQNLYPVLDDLLEDWRGDFKPPFEGVRLIGSRWSPASFEMREFLARNRVPYRWLEASAPEAQPWLEGTDGIPVVVLPNAEKMVQPSMSEVAAKVGLRTQANQNFYDLLIIGGGPAGLAAGVYAASEGLKTAIVEREAPGGQAGLSSRIENYLGFPSGLSGADLARRAVTQAQRFGVEIIAPQSVKSLRVDGDYRIVTLQDDSEVSSHAVIVATGVQWRKLEAPGMERLAGAGVYYGAGSTEALACQNEDVYIIGGANSAGQAAMNFSRFARNVIMLVRGSSLETGMSQYLVDQIRGTSNIRVRLNSSVLEAFGANNLESICIHDSTTDQKEVVAASSLFIFIGAAPRTEWLGDAVIRDKHGFILTGGSLPRTENRVAGFTREPYLLETSLPGVFAVGDVRSGSVKRVASGVGEGSISVAFIHQYLAELR
jgi:thioredoxin reductase (NADPH)